MKALLLMIIIIPESKTHTFAFLLNNYYQQFYLIIKNEDYT